MSDRFQNQLRALVVALVPLVLLAWALTHSYLGNRPDIGRVAEAVASEPVRWALGLSCSGWVSLSRCCSSSATHPPHDHGENRWSLWSARAVTVGLALSVFTPGFRRLVVFGWPVALHIWPATQRAAEPTAHPDEPV